jgi:glucose-1-phosphate adenylyltransferase
MRSRDVDQTRVRDVVAVVLAGGKGARLEPLTRDRAKPAVPFGGGYRIIDFALSNCVNSGLRRVLLLTQYKASSLDRHLNLGWHRLFCRDLGEFLDVLPPQQRVDENWYLGTADAVYQNIYSLEMAAPRLVIVLAGDHIYKMNYQSLIEAHDDSGADVTIAALPVSLESASMGIYCCSAAFLLEQLKLDANSPGSRHDFGHDVLPRVINSHDVRAFPFRDENRKRDAYWRDVGTIDAYFEANMDLVEVDPLLNMYDEQWPIRTHYLTYPPPKFVFAGEGHEARRGEATDSLVCPGAILSGGRATRSIIGPGVRVNSFARIEESILFEGVDIGRHAEVRRAIIDKGVRVPAGATIGLDPVEDAARGLTVSPAGVTVVPKGFQFEAAAVAASSR